VAAAASILSAHESELPASKVALIEELIREEPEIGIEHLWFELIASRVTLGVDEADLLRASAGDQDEELSWLGDPRVRGQESVGAEPSAVDGRGRTPLHHAAMQRDRAAAALLLAAGAAVDARDARESTPLHLAALFGRSDVAALLLDAGADIEARDGAGRSPLWLGVGSGQPMARFLRARGADPRRPIAGGQTPLGLAHLAGWSDDWLSVST
jgi:hypothetical protein